MVIWTIDLIYSHSPTNDTDGSAHSLGIYFETIPPERGVFMEQVAHWLIEHFKWPRGLSVAHSDH